MLELESVVQKIVARNGEREVVESSVDEMREFIAKEHAKVFKDEYIIAVKFLISEDGTTENSIETSWFVNPIYADHIPELEDPNMACYSVWLSDFAGDEWDCPILASEFLPELLLIIRDYTSISILDKYSEFRNNLLLTGLEDIDDNKKYELFMHWLTKKI